MYSLGKILGYYTKYVVCRNIVCIRLMCVLPLQPVVNAVKPVLLYDFPITLNTGLDRSMDIRYSRQSIIFQDAEFCTFSRPFYTDFHYSNYPGFAELCQSWKSRVSSDVLEDVYDGNIWKDFQVVDGQPFLCSAWRIGLMIIVDWFQPYERTTCSVGAIYLTLPRSVRSKGENVILVGILPDLHEPQHDINHYH